MKQADHSQDDSGDAVHTAGYESHHQEHDKSHDGQNPERVEKKDQIGNGFLHGNKRLKDLMLVPPGGWRWACPLHGAKFKADFYPELRGKVAEYIKANRLGPPSNLDAWLQDCMCNQNGWGPEVCREV